MLVEFRVPSCPIRFLALALCAVLLSVGCSGSSKHNEAHAYLQFTNGSQTGEVVDIALDGSLVATLSPNESRTIAVAEGSHDVLFYLSDTTLPMCTPAVVEAISGYTRLIICYGQGASDGCGELKDGGTRILVADFSSVAYDILIDGTIRGSIGPSSSEMYSVSPGYHSVQFRFSGGSSAACAGGIDVPAGQVCCLMCDTEPGSF